MGLGGALGLAWSRVAPRHFAWQAWHKLTSTFVLRGKRGATHIHLRFAWQAWHSWRAWVGLVARDATALCVHLRFTWQAWRNLTSTFVLRGRRGTHGTGWRAWVGLVARDAAWHKLTSTFVLRGRRGAISHPPSFCVAGVALMGLGGALGLAWSRVTPRHFAWQAWHKLTSTFVLRGRRGAISHPPSFCVARVALMGLGGALGLAWSRVTPRHFAWQAWRKLTSTFVLCGRRDTISHPPSFYVAGVAQSHIHLRFAWQVWRSWDWVARLGPLGRA